MIRSLNGRQCCNKDERLSFGSCHWDGYELEIPEVSRSHGENGKMQGCPLGKERTGSLVKPPQGALLSRRRC